MRTSISARRRPLAPFLHTHQYCWPVYSITQSETCGAEGQKQKWSRVFREQQRFIQQATLSSEIFELQTNVMLAHVDLGNDISMAIGRFVTVTSSTQVQRTTEAECEVRETGLSDNPVYGRIHFARRKDDTKMSLRYDIWGLSDGSHGFHVHQWGDISAAEDASSTGGHFVGLVSENTVGGEIGHIGPDSLIKTQISGTAQHHRGYIEDEELVFHGPNSIIGRSIVIHGKSAQDTSSRVAHCVIGAIESSSDSTDTAAQATRAKSARAVLQPAATLRSVHLKRHTGFSGANVASGWVEVSETSAVVVREFQAIPNQENIVTVAQTHLSITEGANEGDLTLRITISTTTASSGVIKVHQGTSCNTADSRGDPLYERGTQNDPWDGGASQWSTNGQFGSKFTVPGTGYSTGDIVGRVVVLYKDSNPVACGILEATTALKLKYELDNLQANVNGGIHLHDGTTCSNSGATSTRLLLMEVNGDLGRGTSTVVMRTTRPLAVTVVSYSLTLSRGRLSLSTRQGAQRRPVRK